MLEKTYPRKSIHYVVEGQGPPVILIHGIAASLFDWTYLLPDLVSCGFSVYALDLPGHGKSFKPEEAQFYHYQSLLGELESWIEELDLFDTPIFIGHSLGGFLSLDYALHNPRKARALVLIDPYFSISQLSPLFRFAARMPEVSTTALKLAPEWLIDAALGFELPGAGPLSPETRRQVAQDYKRTSPKVMHLIPTLPDLDAALAWLKVPTQIIWGDKDLTLDPTSFPHLVNRLPRAAGHAIPGCGHQPHLARPEVVNQLVLEFLADGL